jgi:hemerythrin superfamily protein
MAVVSKVIEALSVHAAIEEMVFYPAVRKALAGTDAMVLEGLEEHHVVKILLKELDGMPATDERFVAKMTVLTEIVRHHVEDEEKDLFPQVRNALTRPQLDELGHELLMAKQGVSKRPHPGSPDTPPGNVVAAVMAMPIDAAKNAGEAAVRKVRSLAGR